MRQLQKLQDQIGETVEIEGWVHTVRSQKRMRFLVIRIDGGKIQCVVDNQTQPELGETVSRLTRESIVRISGVIVENKQVGLGGLEIQIQTIEHLSLADPALPIDITSPTQSGIEPRMDWKFLDLRRPESRLIFEIQTEVEWAMRQYWKQNRFIEIHTPKLMATASESGAELFEVGYFGKKAYLAQSPQFYKQMAMRPDSIVYSKSHPYSGQTRRSRLGTTRNSRAWTSSFLGSSHTRMSCNSKNAGSATSSHTLRTSLAPTYPNRLA